MPKKLPKILTTIFFLIFVFQLAGLIFLLAVPAPSQAIDFVPQVGIGDDFKKGASTTVPSSTKMIGDYINAIYKYAIGIVGILAAVVLMFGGVLWITAGGNAERIGNAKSRIGAALTGLVLTLASYTILYTVNPDLVNFKITTIQNVEDNKSTTTQSDVYQCGQYIDAENICGTKCEGNKKCEKVVKGTVSAKECPKTLNGNGDYWLCTTLSGGGLNCCTDNNDSQCNSGFVCNMKIITADCTGKGVCAVKQDINGICGENPDCISNNCDTGWLATYRCQLGVNN